MTSFILEGVDNTGKTTIARDLERKGCVYHHEGPPPADAFNHYRDLMLAVEKPTVFDRLYHGELVYGPILRGFSQLSMDELTLLERLRRARGIISILCNPPWLGIRDRWEERKEDELVKSVDTLNVAWKAYHNLHFDFTVASPKLPKYVLNAESLTLPLGYVGSPTAQFLFVGEIPNGPVNVPFFAVNNSSKFLNDSIKAAGFLENEIAFTNAFDPAGRSQKILKFPKIIALGAAAAEECSRQGQEGVIIPHPSYWKRFHHSELDRYVKILRRQRDSI